MTLLEVLIALALFSSLLLPVGMFMIEYLKGSSRLGDFNQVLNLLEERMEMAMAQPFGRIPLGESRDELLAGPGGRAGIDLRPAQLGKEQVRFTLEVTMVPVEFSAVVEPTLGRLERIRLEEGMKRLTIRARWGGEKSQTLEILAYKADL